MVGDWLIVADDLTGAADCAIAFARRGDAAAVGWGSAWSGEARPTVCAIDARSRGAGDAAAAQRHADILDSLLAPGTKLYKKIDSTLRGHVGAEVAAVMRHLKTVHGSAFGICAPAFPATGRTMVDGRLRVAGKPLEETEVWRRDNAGRSADLAGVLAAAGVASVKLNLAVVRGGGTDLAARLRAVATGSDIIAICDAETDEDLRNIAAAALEMGGGSFLVGSAGLAHALAAARTGRSGAVPALAPDRRGCLIVVGSPATPSREAARLLAASDGVVHFAVGPETLLNDVAGCAALGHEIGRRLASSLDVMVEIAPGEGAGRQMAHCLPPALARMLEPVRDAMSGFGATGGETAGAVLDRFGIEGIHMVDEIAPGIALGLSFGMRTMPVITKAGAFGDDRSLLRMVERLRIIRTRGTMI